MNLKLIQEYCSIKELDEISLPDFVVLTGVNGAGKTHLLKAMSCRSIEVKSGENVLNNIKYVNFSEKPIYDHSYTTAVQKNEEIVVKEMIDNYKRTGELSTSTSISLDYSNRSLPDQIKSNIQQLMIDLDVTYDKLDVFMYKYWKTNFDNHQMPFEMFRLSELFTCYYEARIKNDFKKFREDPSALSDKEFEQTYGKDPLDIFNKYLKSLNKDFEIDYDIPEDFDLKHRVSIKNSKTGDKIAFSSLSTGEQMFLRVLLVAFSNDLGILTKPDIILLDEIDSGLHPTMMKEFLSLIKNIFLKELNVKVILTTHSPTTVALVDEDSLYLVAKDLPRLSKISKRDAISKLTSELPFLRVDYEVVKQVFVESEEDEKVYRDIYGILFANNQINKDIPLTFIGSGVTATPNSGNCESVKKFATELLSSGNANVFGIIDYDNKNMGKDNIFVIAESKKYSIETCILDPVLVGMYLIREKYHNKYSLPFDTFIGLSGATQQDFQCISDKIIDKLGFDTSKLVEIEYANGYKIQVSKEMMEFNGHDLEQMYKDKFVELKQERKLKNAIVQKVINEYSKYCPIDFVEVFNQIINYDN